MTETDIEKNVLNVSERPDNVIKMPGEVKKDISETEDSLEMAISSPTSSDEDTVEEETAEEETGEDEQEEEDESAVQIQSNISHREQNNGGAPVMTFSIQDVEIGDPRSTVVPILTQNNEQDTNIHTGANTAVNGGVTVASSNLNQVHTHVNHGYLNHNQVHQNPVYVQINGQQIEASHVYPIQNHNQVNGINQTVVQKNHQYIHPNHINNQVQNQLQHSVQNYVLNQGNGVLNHANHVLAHTHQMTQPLHTADPKQVKRERARLEDEYSYLPATQIFLQNGTLNPRYNHLFHSGYFMFRKKEAPWLANSLHIFGIAIDASTKYIVYIPVLGCEQTVPGSALSLNPSEPNPRYPKTFLACISGVSYIANRLRVAPERSYNQEQHKEKLKEQQELMMRKHQHTGSVTRYVSYKPGIPETFSIFGVPVYKSQSYYVYIPEFKNEYTVPGIDLSPNPDDTATLLVTIHRRRYHATSLRPVFPELVFQSKAREEERKTDGEHGTETINGQTAEKEACKEHANEYQIADIETENGPKGAEESENTATVNGPSNTEETGSKTKETASQPAGSENDEIAPQSTGAASDERTPQTTGSENKETKPQRQRQLTAFGISLQPKDTYYVHVPDMRQEYIVFGEHISLNDSNTVKITVDGTELVGTEVRPAFIRNNFNPGDREVVPPVPKTEEEAEGESYSPEELETRYELVAFGIPINPDKVYDVHVPALDKTIGVQGKHLKTNPDDKNTILVEIEGEWQEGSSVKPCGTEDSPSSSGESYPLKGLITAFGIPVLPEEKYRVFVPDLQTECIVYGRHIHSNKSNEQTILVIISGLHFEGTSLRLAKSPNCPKYKIGTIISSTERRNRAFRDKEVSGSDTTSSGEEKEELQLDLNIRPPDINQDLPKYVINSVAIFPDKFYCVHIVKDERKEKVIVKGCEFEPLIKDQQFFNIRVNGKLVFVEPYFRIVPVQSGPEGPKTLSRNENSAFGDFKLEISSQICNEP